MPFFHSKAGKQTGTRRINIDAPIALEGKEMKSKREKLSIADARALGEKGNKSMVIVFHFADGQFGYVSWGKDKALCLAAQKLADVMFDTVRNSTRSQGGRR